jgi:hypothetical protein
MWTRYRKTFIPVQLFILVSAVAVLFLTRSLPAAAQLFFVMQFFSVMGARWATRLGNAIERSSKALPLRSLK